MAAIVGVATSRDELASAELDAAQSRLLWHYTRPLVTSQLVPGALRVATIRSAGKRDFLAHHATGRFLGWLFGYVFEEGALERMSAAAALERLFDAAAAELLPAELRQLDGVFFAVLHDAAAATTFMVTDRLGLRPLFFRAGAALLKWSSEAKAAAPVDLTGVAALDRRGVEAYLRVGHLVDDATHVDGVRLAPAASVGVWRDGMDAPTWKRYWSWGEIAQLGHLTIGEAADELARLWPRAVRRAISAAGDRLYLWLSGGFDSRLIAAEIARQGTPIHAITFGQPGSTDLAVARLVGTVLGVRVDGLIFDEATWFDNRERMLYKTDCAAHFLHLHSAAHLHELGEHGDVFIEGFGGDFLLGDAQQKGCTFHDRRADAAVSEQYYQGLSLDFADSYFDIPHIEPFILHNRARRFTRSGGLAVSDEAENVLPFVEGELVRFLMSLPDGLRGSRRLYSEFAKRRYPEVFAELPHAKGHTIDGRDFTGQAVTTAGSTIVIPSNRVSLADYETLLRAPGMISLMTRHLAPEHSILASLGQIYWRHFELWRDRTWQQGPRPWKHGQSRELMARALSFELWASELGLKDRPG